MTLRISSAGLMVRIQRMATLTTEKVFLMTTSLSIQTEMMTAQTLSNFRTIDNAPESDDTFGGTSFHLIRKFCYICKIFDLYES